MDHRESREVRRLTMQIIRFARRRAEFLRHEAGLLLCGGDPQAVIGRMEEAEQLDAVGEELRRNLARTGPVPLELAEPAVHWTTLDCW